MRMTARNVDTKARQKSRTKPNGDRVKGRHGKSFGLLFSFYVFSRYRVNKRAINCGKEVLGWKKSSSHIGKSGK